MPYVPRCSFALFLSWGPACATTLRECTLTPLCNRAQILARTRRMLSMRGTQRTPAFLPRLLYRMAAKSVPRG